MNNYDNYSGIALSSVLGKCCDWIVINNQPIGSSNFQFGFKKDYSTTQCTFVIDECINIYVYNKTFCSTLYGFPLSDYSCNTIQKLFIAWFKPVKNTLRLSVRTHSNLVHQIVCDMPLEKQLHSRFLKFVSSCPKNYLSCLLFKLASNGSNSTMCKNINHICNLYDIAKYDVVF